MNNNLIGKKYKNAEIIDFIGIKNQKKIWLVKCKCGNNFECDTSRINKETKYECSICTKKRKRDKLINNLKDKRFGDSLVICFLDCDKNGRSIWKVKCKCGDIFYRAGDSLLNGHYNCKKCANKIAAINRSKKEIIRKFDKTSLIGYKNDKIEVIDYAEKPNIKSNQGTWWKIRCSCGNEFIARKNAIIGKNKLRMCRKCSYGIVPKGKNHLRWDHNKTDEDRLLSGNRHLLKEYKDLCKTMLIENNYVCYCCNKIGGKFNIHHLNSFHWSKNERLNKNNLVVLCKKCHKEFHDLYGLKFNTRFQFYNYLQSLIIEYDI